MLVTNSAESGATAGDETVVTPASSGGASGTPWEAVTIDPGCTCVFDNAQAAHGSWSYRQATGATSGQVMLIWNSGTLGSLPRLWGRFYYRTSGTGLRALMRVRSGSTQSMRIQTNAVGAIELRNTTNSLVVNSGGANVLAVNTWYRIEFDCVPGSASTCTIRVYEGDSTTLLFEVTGSGNFGNFTSVNEVTFGNAGAGANLPDAWFDDLAVSDTDWIGPAVSAPAERGVAETLTLTDTAARTSARARSTGEAVALADTAAVTVVRARNTANALTLTDAATRTAARARSAGEAVTLSDAWGYTTAKAAAATGALTLADTAGRSATTARSAGETLTLTDQLGTDRAMAVSVVEAISLVDAVTRALTRARTATDSMTFDDTTARRLAQARGVGEALSLVDALASGQSTSVAVAQTLALTDGWQRASAYGRAAAQAITLASTAARVRAVARSVTEALALADSTRAGQPPRFLSIAEEVVFSEVATTTAARSRAYGETLRLVDATTRRVTRPAAMAEAVTLSGAFTPARLTRLFTSEALVLEDRVASALGKVRQLFEQLTITGEAAAGSDSSRQPPVAYPHRVTVTSTPARVTDTTAGAGSVRRTL